MPFDQGGGSFAPVNAFSGVPMVAPPPPPSAHNVGSANASGDNPNLPRGAYNPATAIRPGTIGVAAPAQKKGPSAYDILTGKAWQQQHQTDPLGIINLLMGKQDPGNPFQEIPNAKPGGPNAQNIPNAKPGDAQAVPVDAQGPLDPSKIQSEGDFAKALLDNLGVPSTPGMINALTGWEHKEEGSWSGTPTPDRFNPLNTGLSEPGAVNNNLGGGTIAYPNWNEGVQATADTIRQGNMAPILRALQSGDPSQLGRAVSQTPWAEAGYTWDSTQPVGGDSNVTAANAKGNFPKGQEPGAPAQATQSGSGAGGGGGGGGGSQQASGGGGGPLPVGPQAAQVAQQIPLMAMALSQPNQSFDPLSILLASANSEPGQSKQDQQDALGIMTGDNG